MPPVTRLKVADLAPQLTCPLCKGYFIDATTITECLHSFCKTCIIGYLKSNQFCPTCEVQVHKTKPLLSIKPDQTLQSIVYKLVPGLYHAEMRNRKQFLQLHPEIDTSAMDPESRGEMRGHRFIYAPEDPISLVLEFQSPARPSGDRSDQLVVPPRYLNCPAGVTISHLKKLTRMKFNLEPRYHVDIMHGEECLPEDYTLIDVAYVFRWTRDEPLKFTYKIYEQIRKTRRVPRRPPQGVTSAHKEDPSSNGVTTESLAGGSPGPESEANEVGPGDVNGNKSSPCDSAPVGEEGSRLAVGKSTASPGGTEPSDKYPSADKPHTQTAPPSLADKPVVSAPSNGSDPFVGSALLGPHKESPSVTVQNEAGAVTSAVKQVVVSGKAVKRAGSPATGGPSKVPKPGPPDPSNDLNQVLPAVGLTPKIPALIPSDKVRTERSKKTSEPQFEALDLSNHKIRPKSMPIPPTLMANTNIVINTPVSAASPRSSGLKSPAKRGKGQATQTILSIAESLANKQLSNLKNKSNGVSASAPEVPPTINLMTLSQTAEKVRQLEMAMKPNSPLDGQTFPRGVSPPSPSMYGTTLASGPRLPSDTVMLPEKSHKNILKVPEVGKPPVAPVGAPSQPCPGSSESMSILKSFITNRGMSALLKIPTVKPVAPKPVRPVKRLVKGALKSPIETRMHELIKNQQLIKKQQPSANPMAVPKFFQKSSPQKSSFSVSIFRSPNPNVRQIPNPSLLRHQSQDRLPCPPNGRDAGRKDDQSSMPVGKFKLPIIGGVSPSHNL